MLKGEVAGAVIQGLVVPIIKAVFEAVTVVKKDRNNSSKNNNR